MSRRAQRAVALLLLHHQMMGAPPLTVPPLIAAAVQPAPRLPWWRRILAWVQSRYHLEGWEAAE